MAEELATYIEGAKRQAMSLGCSVEVVLLASIVRMWVIDKEESEMRVIDKEESEARHAEATE